MLALTALLLVAGCVGTVDDDAPNYSGVVGWYCYANPMPANPEVAPYCACLGLVEGQTAGGIMQVETCAGYEICLAFYREEEWECHCEHQAFEVDHSATQVHSVATCPPPG